MKRALDRIDLQILDALQNDARLSNKELAAQVSLAPSTCLERVRRLRADGVLQGFHAVVDPQALCIGLEAMISVRLGRHSRDLARSFADRVGERPETVALYHVAGPTDFLVHVAVEDVSHLRRFTFDEISGTEGVAQVETSVIFEKKRGFRLPRYGPAAE